LQGVRENKKSLINQGFKGTFHMNRILKNCGVNFERLVSPRSPENWGRSRTTCRRRWRYSSCSRFCLQIQEKGVILL